jgi:hypothetical protein
VIYHSPRSASGKHCALIAQRVLARLAPSVATRALATSLDYVFISFLTFSISTVDQSQCQPQRWKSGRGTMFRAIKEMSFEDMLGISAGLNVPYYQRRYRWTAPEVKKLVADMFHSWQDSIAEESTTAISRRRNDEYFLGTIVLMPRDRGADIKDSMCDIVDGQRTTTFFVILAVMRYLARNSYKDEEFADTLDSRMKINNEYALQLPDGGGRDFHYVFSENILKEDGIKTILESKENDPNSQTSQDEKSLLKKTFVQAVKAVKDALNSTIRAATSKKIEPAMMSEWYGHRLKDYANFIYSKSLFLVIVAQDLDSAYKVFYTLNSGDGLPLTPMEFLRAKMMGHRDQNKIKQGAIRVIDRPNANMSSCWSGLESKCGAENLHVVFTQALLLNILQNSEKFSLPFLQECIMRPFEDAQGYSFQYYARQSLEVVASRLERVAACIQRLQNNVRLKKDPECLRHLVRYFYTPKTIKDKSSGREKRINVFAKGVMDQVWITLYLMVNDKFPETGWKNDTWQAIETFTAVYYVNYECRTKTEVSEQLVAGDFIQAMGLVDLDAETLCDMVNEEDFDINILCRWKYGMHPSAKLPYGITVRTRVERFH